VLMRKNEEERVLMRKNEEECRDNWEKSGAGHPLRPQSSELFINFRKFSQIFPFFRKFSHNSPRGTFIFLREPVEFYLKFLILHSEGGVPR
jgi:hypothetical protein